MERYDRFAVCTAVLRHLYEVPLLYIGAVGVGEVYSGVFSRAAVADGHAAAVLVRTCYKVEGTVAVARVKQLPVVVVSVRAVSAYNIGLDLGVFLGSAVVVQASVKVCRRFEGVVPLGRLDGEKLFRRAARTGTLNDVGAIYRRVSGVKAFPGDLILYIIILSGF